MDPLGQARVVRSLETGEAELGHCENRIYCYILVHTIYYLLSFIIIYYPVIIYCYLLLSIVIYYYELLRIFSLQSIIITHYYDPHESLLKSLLYTGIMTCIQL